MPSVIPGSISPFGSSQESFEKRLWGLWTRASHHLCLAIFFNAMNPLAIYFPPFFTFGPNTQLLKWNKKHPRSDLSYNLFTSFKKSRFYLFLETCWSRNDRSLPQNSLKYPSSQSWASLQFKQILCYFIPRAISIYCFVVSFPFALILP